LSEVPGHSGWCRGSIYPLPPPPFFFFFFFSFPGLSLSCRWRFASARPRAGRRQAGPRRGFPFLSFPPPSFSLQGLFPNQQGVSAKEALHSPFSSSLFLGLRPSARPRRKEREGRRREGVDRPCSTWSFPFPFLFFFSFRSHGIEPDGREHEKSRGTGCVAGVVLAFPSLSPPLLSSGNSDRNVL